jgi:hypothetical protein
VFLAGDNNSMSGTDPSSRTTPADAERQRQQLEYLQGMAKAPMGWPAMPPSPEALNPAELQAMLDRASVVGPPNRPWYRRRDVLVALGLFAALLLALIWLVSLGMK